MGERVDGELGAVQCGLAVGDQRAGGGGELEVAGEEVGVEVGLDDPFDPQPVGGGILEVLVDVALRVDDHRSAGRLVTDEIGGV